MYVCIKIVTGFAWNQEDGIRDGADTKLSTLP